MKTLIAKFMVLATLGAVAVLTGCATTAGGDRGVGPWAAPASDFDRHVVRMVVFLHEAGYRGPALLTGLNYNWNDTAKRNYRWTFATAYTGVGGLTGRYFGLDAAVIAEGVPLLVGGDIIDVYVLPREEMNLEAGIAPIILKRICSAKDEPCLNALKKAQGGRVAGILVDELYPNAKNTKLAPPLKDNTCVFLGFGCTGHL